MEEVVARQAFLITSNSILKQTIDLYEKLQSATLGIGDVFLLYHSQNIEAPEIFENIKIKSFSNDILTKLKYKPIYNSILPGSNHFPILNFFLEHPDYRYYWCIENDVAFNGTWDDFFNNLSPALDYDFITSHIRKYSTFPKWRWWNSFDVPSLEINQEDLVRCFNPIYRISNKALQHIDMRLKEGCSGHHEVLYPSLLQNGGFKLADFSTEENYITPILSYCTLKTMRWRPVYFFAGFQKNKLYHPVKSKVTVKQLLEYLRRTVLNKKFYLTS